jgi:serine/threonine-protein kinase RsbW
MVLAEVLNNIVEHGYPNPQKPGPIGVQCTLVGSGLDIALTDTGEPMPNGEPPIGNAPNTNVQFADLPEGEFGWFLIKIKSTFPKRATGETQLRPESRSYSYL